MGGCRFNIWDMSGQSRYRDLWQHYYDLAAAVIFVVDLTDANRMSVAKAELDRMVSHPHLKGKPFLLFGNKMDHPAALHSEKVWSALAISELRTDDRELKQMSVSGHGGDNIKVGINWLAEQLQHRVHHDVV